MPHIMASDILAVYNV